MNNFKFDIREYMMFYPFLSKKECKTIIKKLKKLDWYKHSYNDANTDIKAQFDNDLYIIVPPENDEYFKSINDKIGGVIDNYRKDIDPFCNLHGFMPIRYNRYKKGEEMRKHVDHISSLFDGTRKGVPILTVLGSLNDDYTGGDLILFDDTKVNIPIGNVLVFPSTFMYPHAVKPVIKGKRYSFVTWVW